MDRRLRELERRAAAGDSEAEARLLASRVRAGSLSRARLHVAAILDHKAARLADPQAPTAPAPGVPVGRLSKRKNATRHGLRTAAAIGTGRPRFPDTIYPSTFCGRRRRPEHPKPESHGAHPSCRTCLRSDYWRLALVDALGERVARVADLDPALGFKCGVMAVEHVMASYLAVSRDSAHTRRFAEYALWGCGGVQGRPPAPGSNPNSWDPAGLFDEGAQAWVYGLGCAALDLADGSASLPVTLRNLMRPVAAWCHNTGDGRKHTLEMLAHLRATIVPHALGYEEDPLAAVAVHYREVAHRQLTEES